MKTATYQTNKAREYIPYPNAATRRQVADRILEGLLVFAAGAGLGAAVLLGMVLA